MLRAAVIVAAAIVTCVGALLVSRGVPMPGWQMLGMGLIVLAGTMFERWRYGRTEPPPDGRWQRTSERFLDPSSGETLEVLYDPRTGERRYVSAKSQQGQREENG